MSNESFFDAESTAKAIVGGGAGLGLAIAVDQYILQPYAERTKQMNAATSLLTELDIMERAYWDTKNDITKAIAKDAPAGSLSDLESKAAARVLAQKAFDFQNTDFGRPSTRPEAWSAFAKAHGGEKVIAHLQSLSEEGRFSPTHNNLRMQALAEGNSLGVLDSPYAHPRPVNGLLDRHRTGMAADLALSNIGEMATAIDWDKELGARGVFSRSILSTDPKREITLGTLETYKVPTKTQSTIYDLTLSDPSDTPKVRSRIGTVLGAVPETLANARGFLRPSLAAVTAFATVGVVDYIIPRKQ